MRNGKIRILSRIVILIVLISISYYHAMNMQFHFLKYKAVDLEYPKFTNKPPHSSNITFPIFKKEVSEDEVSLAINHLKLPVWSYGYTECNSNESEVSCYEIVKASQEIRRYEHLFNVKKLTGKIYININNANFADQLSMIYQGFAIALATKKTVFFDHSKFSIYIPYSINRAKKISGSKLPFDYKLSCANILNSKNILIDNYTWPQVMYTHYFVAPYLREKFGFHAAYLLGNYLFGEAIISDDCKLNSAHTVINLHEFFDDQLLNPRFISPFIPNSIHKPYIMTNANIYNEKKFAAVEVINENKKCNLYKLMSAKKIYFTFGSRFGFWAAALLGAKSGYFNPVDRVFTELTLSQSGSLFHTKISEDIHEIFRTNNRMFVCGPNIMDVRLYFEYLLW